MAWPRPRSCSEIADMGRWSRVGRHHADGVLQKMRVAAMSAVGRSISRPRIRRCPARSAAAGTIVFLFIQHLAADPDDRLGCALRAVRALGVGRFMLFGCGDVFRRTSADVSDQRVGWQSCCGAREDRIRIDLAKGGILHNSTATVSSSAGASNGRGWSGRRAWAGPPGRARTGKTLKTSFSRSSGRRGR